MKPLDAFILGFTVGAATIMVLATLIVKFTVGV